MPKSFERQIFPNIPVQDVKRSREFFTKLGFTFNERISNEKGLSMVISDNAAVMLLDESFFRTFTDREPCDTARNHEVIIAVSCESREAVDKMVKTAIANGGAAAKEPTDHGFMYAWSFLDPDGHYWEPLWFNPDAPENQ